MYFINQTHTDYVHHNCLRRLKFYNFSDKSSKTVYFLVNFHFQEINNKKL